jgi:phosphoglycerol transferase MdoB-like AlkP superfamily enzyme
MNSVKIISKILFYLTRLLAIAYFVMFAHSIIALVTGWSLQLKKTESISRFVFLLPIHPTS